MEPYGHKVGNVNAHSNSKKMKTMNKTKSTPLSWLWYDNIFPRVCIAYLAKMLVSNQPILWAPMLNYQIGLNIT